ncbi:MAG: response regulator transcription factor [Vampirovibrionia bacterium]
MKKIILIADDEVCWLSSHKEIIELSFSDLFELKFASSAKEAIEEAEKIFPDLLITDLQMEIVEKASCAGEYLIKKLKSINENLKVIIISGAPDIEMIANRNNVEQFIPKWALMNYPIALKMALSEIFQIKIKKC